MGWLQQRISERGEGKISENKREEFNSRKFDCVWSNDVDKYASQIYRKNFGKKELIEADIKTINPNTIPNFNLLTAGFPCQSFSVAGKRKGFQDTRGTLFYEICRIAKTKRPALLLLENVKGLLSHDEGLTFQIILESLEELGYWCEWQVLNSKHFGVPQNRERVFIIGRSAGSGGGEIFPIGETSEKFNIRNSKEQIATSLQHPGHSGGNYRGMTMVADYRNDEGLRIRKEPISPTLATRKHSSTDISTMPPLVIPTLTPDRMKRRQEGRRFKENDDSMFTLTGQDVHGVKLEHSRIRRLTPIECERLQGFPDNWTKGVSDTQRYKCLGNAVTVNVIEFLGKSLYNSIV